LGEIIQTIGIFIVGIAAGYTWRDRISKARRAEEHERRERRRQQADKRAASDVFRHIGGPS
jgi:hypothetical protein